MNFGGSGCVIDCCFWGAGLGLLAGIRLRVDMLGGLGCLTDWLIVLFMCFWCCELDWRLTFDC